MNKCDRCENKSNSRYAGGTVHPINCDKCNYDFKEITYNFIESRRMMLEDGKRMRKVGYNTVYWFDKRFMKERNGSIFCFGVWEDSSVTSRWVEAPEPLKTGMNMAEADEFMNEGGMVTLSGTKDRIYKKHTGPSWLWFPQGDHLDDKPVTVNHHTIHGTYDEVRLGAES